MHFTRVFLIDFRRSIKNFTHSGIFITDFDMMTRGESGSAPNPTPHCFPGGKDGITSVVTGNAAPAIEGYSGYKKFSTGKGSHRSIAQVFF